MIFVINHYWKGNCCMTTIELIVFAVMNLRSDLKIKYVFFVGKIKEREVVNVQTALAI